MGKRKSEFLSQDEFINIPGDSMDHESGFVLADSPSPILRKLPKKRNSPPPLRLNESSTIKNYESSLSLTNRVLEQADKEKNQDDDDNSSTITDSDSGDIIILIQNTTLQSFEIQKML